MLLGDAIESANGWAGAIGGVGVVGVIGAVIGLYRYFRKAKSEGDLDAAHVAHAQQDYQLGVLRGIIEDVREENKGMRRDFGKVQAAHIECEKRQAAQEVVITQMTEVLTVTRADLKDARLRIKELEDKSDDPPRPRGSRLACAGLAVALLFAPLVSGADAAERMQREVESNAVEWWAAQQAGSR